MSTIIVLDGGLGRIITAIPALLKYHKNHPDEEWYVMISSWDFVAWGIPELQERTFNSEEKGSFQLFWKADKIISPEPYRVPAYYRNEISLREAFDIEINGITGTDLPPMQLKLSLQEKRSAYELISYVKRNQHKSKTIVIQPYGSSATSHPTGVCDDSLRSIPEPMLDYFIDNLSKRYNLIFMGSKDLAMDKVYVPDPDPNLREWAAVIDSADYFIGCDSCGQHMCAALNKQASVVIAGTHKVNVSYEHFHIIERDIPFYPDAMRVSGFQSHMASRLNESRIEFTQSEIETAYEQIIERIERNKKSSEVKLKKMKGVLYS